MKHFMFTSFVALLLSIVIFTSGCDSNETSKVQSVVTCFGNVAVKVIAGAMTDTEPLTWGSLITVIPDCINAAIATFSSPSNSNPSSPEVTINPSPTDGAKNGSVSSNIWSNCTTASQTLTFDFSVPFKVVVGASPDQGQFDAAPTGTSDNELIAQQLFQQYGSYIASITSSGPSQSIRFTVAPETQIKLNLPIQLSYREGEARIVHTDGSSVALPWLFTDGYQQAGPITSTSWSC